MRRTETLWIIMMSAMITSCIRSYEPEILASDAKKYVISGQVTAGDSLQRVNVSMTSPIGHPSYFPVQGCTVMISDDAGHQFQMTDVGHGDYIAVINPQFLQPGVSYKVEVKAPDGGLFESDFDLMPHVAEIDSVYFQRKDIEGSEPGQFTLGIQFYVDVKGSEESSPYYRWEEFETWEYHASFPLEWWYNGTVHHVVPPDYSENVCWKTERIPNIFTLSTTTLAENKYEQLPLHYVNNTTSRLAYGYSLLVRQYSISEIAFIYWENLRVNSNPEGGLYEKQPLAIQGNIHDLNHPDNSVLGFFGASHLVSKRIFVKDVLDLPLDYNTYCDPETLMFGLGTIKPKEYPAYLVNNPLGGYFPHIMNKECVHCTLLGGTIVKPDFWPF